MLPTFLSWESHTIHQPACKAKVHKGHRFFFLFAQSHQEVLRLNVVVSIALMVDELEGVHHHGGHPEYSGQWPGRGTAFEPLVQVTAQPVDDQEPQPDILKVKRARGVKKG